jgi:hypothetical protein
VEHRSKYNYKQYHIYRVCPIVGVLEDTRGEGKGEENGRVDNNEICHLYKNKLKQNTLKAVEK